MTKTQQALLSLLIRVGVIAAVAVINFITAGLTNGTLELPIPAVLVPFIGLVLSEADTWLVNWQTASPTA